MPFTHLILASSSPRRHALLEQIGFRHRVHPSAVEEAFNPRMSPVHNVKRIALEKAVDVARNYTKGIVLAADTVVVVGRRVLGKPSSAMEARAMLKLLSGREHIVCTGFALIDADSRRRVIAAEKTRVRFRALGDREIRDYVRTGSPLDKAGAYGIQDDLGAVFVERISGCFYNVMGLPVSRFYLTYRRFLATLHH